MKLVGATNWFIRWPFLIEGAMIGFGWSIDTVSIISYVYLTGYSSMTNNLASSTYSLLEPNPFVLTNCLIAWYWYCDWRFRVSFINKEIFENINILNNGGARNIALIAPLAYIVKNNLMEKEVTDVNKKLILKLALTTTIGFTYLAAPLTVFAAPGSESEYNQKLEDLSTDQSDAEKN